MVGVIWYRFVRCGGTDWSDTLVPIRPLQWYRLKRYVGTDSSATVVPIRRYYHVRLHIYRRTVLQWSRSHPIVLLTPVYCI